MTETVIGIRLVADGSGLVGQLRLSRAELDALTGSAKNTSAAFEAGAAAGQNYANMAARLHAALDPMYAVQQRFDQELREADALLKMGAISQRTYADAVRLANDNLRAGTAAVHGANAGLQSVNAMTGQTRQGFQQLAYNVSDMTTMWSMGARPAQIFSSQIGQLAQAVQLASGGTSKFATFMGGGWGVGITAAVMVLGPLAATLMDAGDAADDAKVKTYDFSKSLDVLTLSAKASAQAMEQLANKTSSAIKVQGDYLTNEAKNAENAVKGIESRLAKSRSELSKINKENETFGFFGSGFGAVPALNASRKSELAKTIADDEKALANARLAQQNADIALSQRRVADAMDESTAATNRFNEAVGKLEQQRRRSMDDQIGATADGTFISKEQYDAELTRLTKIKNAAIEAHKKVNSKPTSSGLFGKEIGLAEAKSIASGARLRVTSALRTKAEQQWLYDNRRTPTNPVALPGTSAHEKGNALDIAFGKGISAASIKKAYADAGVKLTKILKEDGHFHIEWSTKGADKVEREVEKIDNFGERAAESIARVNAQFDAQSRLIDQAKAATSDLDKMIAELSDKKPLNWEGMVADAQAAKGTIQEALVRPYQQLRQESERRLQIDALITAGREEEAAALQIIWQKESELGPMTAARKQDVLDMVTHERAVTDELARRREVIGYYLDASRSIRDTFTEFFSSGSFNFKGIGQAFQRLNGQVISEQLFGGTFRDLDTWLKGQSGLSPSVDFMSAQTERAGSAAGEMADAFLSAKARMGSAAGTGTLESQFDQVFGKSLVGGPSQTAASVLASWRDMLLNGDTPKGGSTVPGNDLKGSVMTLSPANFFSELIRRASTGLKLNLGEDTVRSLGKFAQGGMWGQFGSQMVTGKSGGVGSFIGGAFGESLFKSAAPKLFKSLGSFAGPIGSIAGGILGGLIGGLFSKAKTGGVAIGAVNGAGAITGTGGNNAQLKSQLSGSGNSVNSALAQIAQQLGGSIGSYSVAIGMRKDEFRVSASGNVGNTTAKKTGSDIVYKGKDEAAAIQAALANAIQDGAIKGLSAAVQRALQSSSNMDQAIQEALKVQEVELAIGGIGAALAKQFADFDKQAAERLRIATQYGFDVVAMEKRNAADRLKLSEKLLAEQVGSLQQLIDNLTSGSLFEGTAMDKRQALLDKISAAKADAAAGVEGAADKLANLLEQLNSASKDAYGTTGAFATDRATILDTAREAIARANQRITDAQTMSDPALAATNAALDENNSQNAAMIAALGMTNAHLAQLIASGGSVNSNLAALARTSLA